MPRRRLSIPLIVCLAATVLASTGEVSSGSTLCFGGSGHLQIEAADASCCSHPTSDARVPFETCLCRASCCSGCTDIELGYDATNQNLHRNGSPLARAYDQPAGIARSIGMTVTALEPPPADHNLPRPNGPPSGTVLLL